MKTPRENANKVPDEDITERCGACKGLGSSSCSDCDGDGTRECDMGHDHDCDACAGLGLATCEACEGYGCLDAARGSAEAEAWKRCPDAARRWLLANAWRMTALDGPRGGRVVDWGNVHVALTVRFRPTAEDRDAMKAAGLRRTKWKRKERKGVEEWQWTSAREALATAAETPALIGAL